MTDPVAPTLSIPLEFGTAAMTLVGDLIPTTALSFYFVDPHIHIRGFVGVNVDPEIEKEYNELWETDPLCPRNFEDRDDSVVSSNTTYSRERWQHTGFYRSFMKPRGFEHCADMFFRSESGIIAALLTVRDSALGEYTEPELERLAAAQHFIEYSLNKIYQPPRLSERRFIAGRYELTPRETDVLEAAMTGISNKKICAQLGMSLPTLRTHLQHIFAKVGVSSATELIATVFRDLANERAAKT